MARQYPMIGEHGLAATYDKDGKFRSGRISLKDKSISCYCCSTQIGKNAETPYNIDIQVDWFRGDDEVYFVCFKCYRLVLSIRRKNGDISAIRYMDNQHKKLEKDKEK